MPARYELPSPLWRCLKSRMGQLFQLNEDGLLARYGLPSPPCMNGTLKSRIIWLFKLKENGLLACAQYARRARSIEPCAPGLRMSLGYR